MMPPEAGVRRFRQATAQQKLCGQGLPEATAQNRWQLLELAIAHIGPATPLTLLEFGVAKGQSLALFAKRFVNTESQFVGFDSFQGLPEDWKPGPTIAKGTFSTGGEPPRIPDRRVHFVKGWFQNTVAEFFKSPTADLSRTVLVHYDSDLYSSTLFLLTTVWHFVPEYFFIMDDFAFDESVALLDFSSAYPVTIEWLAKRLNAQGTPVQMFGQMRRSEFQVK
jgi:O-methyltransferase